MKKLILLITLFIISLSIFAQNWNFENWTTINVLNLDSYYTAINDWGIAAENTVIRSTDSYLNSYSLRLETAVSFTGDTIFGYFMNGDIETYKGGHPLSITSMDSVIGYYKYDIPAGDTAWFICTPKHLGVPTGNAMISITGTQSSWTRFSFPVNAATCDSVLLAAASSNAFIWNGVPGSYIMFDDIKYVSNSTTENAINGDFEYWTINNWEEPDEWETPNHWVVNSPVMPVEQTTDSYSGSYAAKLTTIYIPLYNDTVSGAMTNGYWDDYGPAGGIEFSAEPIGMELYFKYAPAGQDTAWFSANFKNNGNSIAFYGTFFPPMGTYTLWNCPISLPATPDTLLITFYAGNNLGSELFIDQISFSYPVAIDENFDIHELIAYPVPAKDELKFKFNMKQNANVNIKILNISGSVLIENNYSKNSGTQYETIDISNIPSGTYIYKITIDNKSYNKTFTVQ